MATLSQSEVEVSIITDASDIPDAFAIVRACFGEQVPDAILAALNPSWDTPEGYAKAVDRFTKGFKNAVSRDKNGDPTKFYLKATVTDSAGEQHIAGLAVWLELSAVESYGAPMSRNIREALDVENRLPGDASEQEYCCRLFDNLQRQRYELVEQQSSASPPAILVLDLCVVHPNFQKRGIASKLVQYGLDEAKRRGGLVCSTEASPMGRTVYAKLGFRQQGPEIEYDVDGAKFAKNGMPSNVFMRT